MEEASSSLCLCKFLDSEEEVIVDRDGKVFDPILSMNSISESKENFMEF